MSPLPVYSKAFIIGNSQRTYVYTCPSGYVALISCIDAHVGSTTSGGNWIVMLNGTAIIGFVTYLPVAPQDFTYRGKIVLQPGETITVYSDASDLFDISVTGDLLTNP